MLWSQRNCSSLQGFGQGHLLAEYPAARASQSAICLSNQSFVARKWMQHICNIRA